MGNDSEHNLAGSHETPSSLVANLKAFRDHRRTFDDFRYIYPVLSRRSQGLSIGVNLNPDKRCNFDCSYCQVDRTQLPPVSKVEVPVLATELAWMLDHVLDGEIWKNPRFAATPVALRRLNDIALSGDGEPTTEKRFCEIVELISRLKSERGLDLVKIVLITDSACLHQAHVEQGLEVMDRANGEIWAKLDAGTEPFFREVCRTQVPFARVLDNLERCCEKRPIVIQTCFFQQHGQSPSSEEIEAYIACLRHLEHRGTLKEIHLYTIARQPAESWCMPLESVELDAVSDMVQEQVEAPVKVFYGAVD